jgi:hypothetical protein
VDISTGMPVGAGDFLINSANLHQQIAPQIGVSGNLAFVVWLDKPSALPAVNIQGRIVDIANATPVGAGDFIINSTNVVGSAWAPSPQLVVSGNMALVTWETDNAVPNQPDIRGRIVDMSIGIPVSASDFLISSTNTNNQKYPQLAVFGIKQYK